MTDASHLLATSRAARIIAGAASRQRPEDMLTPLREAQADDEVFDLVLALAVRCVQLATELHGEKAQHYLDEFALDSIGYQQRLLGGH